MQTRITVRSQRVTSCVHSFTLLFNGSKYDWNDSLSWPHSNRNVSCNPSQYKFAYIDWLVHSCMRTIKHSCVPKSWFGRYFTCGDSIGDHVVIMKLSLIHLLNWYRDFVAEMWTLVRTVAQATHNSCLTEAITVSFTHRLMLTLLWHLQQGNQNKDDDVEVRPFLWPKELKIRMHVRSYQNVSKNVKRKEINNRQIQ